MSNGSVPMTGTFDGGAFKITNIVDGTALTDAVTLSQLNASGDFMADGSIPMTGDFHGGGFKITGIVDGIADTDAVTVGQLNAGMQNPLIESIY